MKKLFTSLLIGVMAVTAAHAYDVSSLETFNPSFTNYPEGPVSWQGSVSTPGTYAGCTWMYTKNYKNPQYPYHPEWVGKQIVGVKVTNQLTADVDNFKVFVVGNNDPDEANPNTDWQTNKLAVADAVNNNGIIEAFFDTPITIEDGHTYFPGYQFDVTAVTTETSHPYPTFLSKGQDRFAWIWTGSKWDMGMGWISSTSWRALPIFVYLYDPATGEVEEVAMATPQAPAQTTFKVNQPINLTLPVAYNGNKKMQNIEYNYTFNDNTVTAQQNFSPFVEPGQNGELKLTLGTLAEAGTYPFTLTINKVNDKDNTAEVKTVTCDLTIESVTIPSGPATYDPSTLITFTPAYTNYPEGPVSWQGSVSQPGMCAGMTWMYTKNYKNVQYPYHPEWIGKKIVGVKVTNLLTADVDNFKVFVLGTPGKQTEEPNADWQTNKLAVADVVNNNGTIEAFFDTPVTIEEGSTYYPGFQFDVAAVTTETAHPYPTFLSKGQDRFAWIWTGSKWDNDSWISPTSWRALPITVYLYDETATGVENVTNNDSVLCTTYYDLSGREVKDAKGLVIKVEKLAGGNMRTSKVLIK